LCTIKLTINPMNLDSLKLKIREFSLLLSLQH